MLAINMTFHNPTLKNKVIETRNATLPVWFWNYPSAWSSKMSGLVILTNFLICSSID